MPYLRNQIPAQDYLEKGQDFHGDEYMDENGEDEGITEKALERVEDVLAKMLNSTKQI